MIIEDEEKKLSLLKEKIDTLEILEKSKRKSKNWMEKVAHFFRTESTELQKAKRDYSDYVAFIIAVKEERERTQLRTTQWNQYEQLRNDIQKLPQYIIWKNAVYAKNGRKCESCGTSENLEVHHIRSLHSIIRAYQIGNIKETKMQALLWNVNNGQVLCRECHTKTSSSIYRTQQ